MRNNHVLKTINLFVKRFFDLLLSALGIILLTCIPVFIVVSILIKATSKGPVFFKQDRVGRNNRVFKIYKFRTMLIPEERLLSDGSSLPPQESITKVGRFLRKTSLDELPQLFNVFMGSMSLVGPRPMLPRLVNKLTAEENRRHQMRPGITGFAQVNGRNSLTWSEKLMLDVKYVDSFNVRLDIVILFQTVGVIFKKEGIEYTHYMQDERDMK